MLPVRYSLVFASEVEVMDPSRKINEYTNVSVRKENEDSYQIIFDDCEEERWFNLSETGLKHLMYNMEKALKAKEGPDQ